jgi:predicted alpha/beta hydrolase
MSLSSAALTIPADDGYPLAATLAGAEGAGPLTIIAPATAVPARFYARFQQFVAASGRPTLTFDYRGQGQSAPASLKDFPARFRDWGILDMPGVITWAETAYPNRPLHWVGHSYGGFGTGLAHNNARIDRLFAFASMTADVRFMSLKTRLLTWPQFFIGMMIARALGYLPAGLVGTEPLPKPAMLEWYRFCTTKGFIFGVEDLPEVRHFATLHAPVRLAFAEDDSWVSRPGIEHLLTRISQSPDKEIWQISRIEAGDKALGHMGFFRGAFATTLWPKALAWLDAEARPLTVNP